MDVARLVAESVDRIGFATAAAEAYWAEPVSTGWFPVSTVAHFTSISNYLESVPPPAN